MHRCLRNQRKPLLIISWNINGIGKMREDLKNILNKYEPGIPFLLETNLRTVVSQYSDLGCENGKYRVVQIKSTEVLRGGMIALSNMELQLETAQVLRKHECDEFAQAIVLTDRQNKAYIGWYNSPMMSREAFDNALHKLFTDYDTKLITGDFNARHTRWCKAHYRLKRVARLLKLTTEMSALVIHATSTPTFMAIKNRHRQTPTVRSSTVDLVVRKVPIPILDIVDGYITRFSDRHPIVFKVGTDIDRVSAPRGVSKTLLQSDQLNLSVGLLYEVTLRDVATELQTIGPPKETERNALIEERTQRIYEKANEKIIGPWVMQAKRRRRGTGAHVNEELHKL